MRATRCVQELARYLPLTMWFTLEFPNIWRVYSLAVPAKVSNIIQLRWKKFQHGGNFDLSINSLAEVAIVGQSRVNLQSQLSTNEE